MEHTLTLDRLKALCRDFDRKVGTYPEHSHEGWSVFCYITARLSDTPIEFYNGDGPDEYDTRSQLPDDWDEPN
jgi:hypothetical protein